MEKTSIQLSDEVRRRLKILGSQRDISYEEVLKDLINVFEAEIPFGSEHEFAQWFENNLHRFDFKEVVEKDKQRYVLKNENGETKKAEIRLIGSDFADLNGKEKPDLFLCFWSGRDEINGVPVIAASGPSHKKEETMTTNYNSISIPSSLYKKAKAKMVESGFSSVSDYVTFVMRELVAEDKTNDSDTFTKQDEEKIKERLRSLGYLD